MRFLILLVAYLLLFTSSLQAQSSWSRSRCDYNLGRSVSDDYLGMPPGRLGTFNAPRVAHHAIKAGLSLGGAALARRFGLPRKAAAVVGGIVASSLAFHVVGRLSGKYHTVNVPDWTFDASVASLPLAMEYGGRGMAAYAASYAILVCYGSP